MKLVEVNETENQAYNNFVAASKSGSFLQSYEWGEWQQQLGHKIFRYWILNDIGESVGSLLLIKMALPLGKYYLYAPYGPVLAGGENFQFPISNFQIIFNDIKSKFPDAMFIRIEPKISLPATSYKLPAIKSPNIQPGKTLFIDLSKAEEQLLAEMHHKTRYNIKLAQKHGVEIKEELDITIGHGLYFQEAVDLIFQTSARQGFRGYSKQYYAQLVDFFSLNNQGQVKAHIYKAIFQNQLLAAAIMLDFSAKGGSASGGGTRTFLFGGSSEFHKNVMAPYLLHWQAMLDAKTRGFQLYDFWGIETSKGDTPGFVRFKLGFGGVEQSFGGAYDLVLNPLLYKFYLLSRFVRRLWA